MDDLLGEFLTETSESLDVVDAELVRFEQEPSNGEILGNIFRLVHTIKGTCGFLGLPRLEGLAHSAETLMGKYRDGAVPTSDGVSLILQTIDQLKDILDDLGQTGEEPEGDDSGLIEGLDQKSQEAADALNGTAPQEDESEAEDEGLGRPLKPGEVSLADLEAAFNAAPGPEEGDENSKSAPVSSAEQPPKEMPPAPPTQNTSPPAPAAKAGSTKKPVSKDGPPVQTQSIRVNVDTLEGLMTMVSELVLTRNQLLEMMRNKEASEFKVPLQRLSNVTAELQEGVMQTRMQPVGNAWQKLPRIVRDLTKELDKKIDLQMTGAETELDRQVLDKIKDPLTHMVRNSADHGLETTSERIEVGKDEVGKIELSARHEGGHILIEISDDGRGLPTDKIRAKALANGLATEDALAKMSDYQIQKFVFHAGFSTAEKVTSVSGRGVGMDVVRTNIEEIGGTVDVRSTAGEGSVFTIKIPLTLAIVSALIIESDDQKYAIPQLAVSELVRTNNSAEHRIEMMNNVPVLRLRNELLPVVHLGELLGVRKIDEKCNAIQQMLDEDRHVFVVIMQVGNHVFGVAVDSVFHTEEIVVKPMSSVLRDLTIFGGNTILGDGAVIMIIDPNGIAQHIGTTANGDYSNETIAEEKEEKPYGEKISFILFKSGTDEIKAVPLSLVTRLEDISVEDIEHVGQRALLQYRGDLMPLLPVDEVAKIKTTGTQPILVFSDDHHSMGLIVDEIVDIKDDYLNIEVASNQSGLTGALVIENQATSLIDVSYFMTAAFPDWLAKRDTQGANTQAKSSLLLVDDSAFFRSMLQPLLSASGYKVTMAEDALQAMELMEAGRNFDVIVTDIEMPSMSGIEFTNAVKNGSSWADLPVIALSSHVDQSVVNAAREAGVYDFVAKTDCDALIDCLKDLKGEGGKAHG